MHLILKHFWQPKDESNISRWYWSCIPCQKVKTIRHTQAPLKKFLASNKFEHVHIDLIDMDFDT